MFQFMVYFLMVRLIRPVVCSAFNFGRNIKTELSNMGFDFGEIHNYYYTDKNDNGK